MRGTARGINNKTIAVPSRKERLDGERMEWRLRTHFQQYVFVRIVYLSGAKWFLFASFHKKTASNTVGDNHRKMDDVSIVFCPATEALHLLLQRH